MAGTLSRKRFLKKIPSTEKHKVNKKMYWRPYVAMVTPNCNKTQTIRNFHLYIIQLW